VVLGVFEVALLALAVVRCPWSGLRPTAYGYRLSPHG
jgi:hypothetical protein